MARTATRVRRPSHRSARAMLRTDWRAIALNLPGQSYDSEGDGTSRIATEGTGEEGTYK